MEGLFYLERAGSHYLLVRSHYSRLEKKFGQLWKKARILQKVGPVVVVAVVVVVVVVVIVVVEVVVVVGAKEGRKTDSPSFVPQVTLCSGGCGIVNTNHLC